MIFYVLSSMTSQILGLIGLYPIANVLNMAMMFTFGLLMTWSYCRYTGNLTEIGATIDSMSETGKSLLDLLKIFIFKVGHYRY